MSFNNKSHVKQVRRAIREVEQTQMPLHLKPYEKANWLKGQYTLTKNKIYLAMLELIIGVKDTAKYLLDLNYKG